MKEICSPYMFLCLKELHILMISTRKTIMSEWFICSGSICFMVVFPLGIFEVSIIHPSLYTDELTASTAFLTMIQFHTAFTPRWTGKFQAMETLFIHILYSFQKSKMHFTREIASKAPKHSETNQTYWRGPMMKIR